ncbi:RloB domain-containing protein [Niastella caeni]|uniref:RloB domain-containing protein n=1 Tax=Niastella caeni TaxID=2569763 RepID=A0A4S8HM85_9BACT|nr:RloB domain-containing protein [Niastella caeni]THU35801.1 RloB domain-containing protein [Niastella caeni]
MTRKPRRIPSKPKVALVGDGQTEQIYFANVNDTDRPSDLDLFPDLPMKPGSYKSVLNKAVQLVEEYEYERVYVLIDMDKVISDGQRGNEKCP